MITLIKKTRTFFFFSVLILGFRDEQRYVYNDLERLGFGIEIIEAIEA